MNHLEGMPSEEYCAGLRKKWELNDEPDVRRANITALVLNSQLKHLQRLAEETRAIGIAPCVKELLPALKSALMTHLLLDICAVQPMTGPIGLI